MKKLFYLIALIASFTITSCSVDDNVKKTSSITLPVLDSDESIYQISVTCNTPVEDMTEGYNLHLSYVFEDNTIQEYSGYPVGNFIIPENVVKFEVILTVIQPGFSFKIFHNGVLIEDVSQPNGTSYLKVYYIN